MSIAAVKILGLPLVAWGGITVLLLLATQVLIGLRIIKVDFKYHKILGLVVLALAVVHGTLAMLYILGK